MEKKDNIYDFDNLTEWLEYTSRLGSVLSPGGFAQAAGVARTTVNNWIHRDKLIDFYRCKADGGGEYGVIPESELEKIKDRKKTASSN